MFKRVAVTRAHWKQNRWHLHFTTAGASQYKRLTVAIDAPLADAIDAANAYLDTLGLTAEWVSHDPPAGQPHAVAATVTKTEGENAFSVLAA